MALTSAQSTLIDDYNKSLAIYNQQVNALDKKYNATDGKQFYQIPEVRNLYNGINKKYQNVVNQIPGSEGIQGGKHPVLKQPNFNSGHGTTGWAAVAKQALPIAAAFIPGLGPLASAAVGAALGGGLGKAQGGSWGDALKGAAVGGISGYVGGGGFGDIKSALGLDGLLGDSLSTADNAFLNSAKSAAANGTTGLSALPSGTQSFLDSLSGGGGIENISDALAHADPSLVSKSAASGAGGLDALFSKLSPESLLSTAVDKLTNSPLQSASALATLGSALTGNKVNGTQTQDQILQQMQHDKAAQAAQSAKFIQGINNASTGRTPITPAITDYYSYGSRPQASFFDQVNTPIAY